MASTRSRILLGIPVAGVALTCGLWALHAARTPSPVGIPGAGLTLIPAASDDARSSAASDQAEETREAPAAQSEPEFRRFQRPGSVDLRAEYDLANITIPEDQIHTLLPRDAIPALTDPKLQSEGDAEWLPGNARVIEIMIGDSVLGVPLRVLDWHEIVNTTIGSEPVAVTYCPLCDSAAVFSRRVTPANAQGDEDPAEATVLEFGVSGALYNSNVLMYDRTTKGLWSQLGMHAVSGPLAGTALRTLPVEVVSFAEFRRAHPGASIVSNDTGHARDYSRSPYEAYFKDEGLMVPVVGVGNALPRKTLGVGIACGEGAEAKAWFCPADAIQGQRTIHTPLGEVVVERNGAGVVVSRAPEGVRTAQTMYYSWSAFYPNSVTIRPGDGAEPNPPADTTDGVPVGIDHTKTAWSDAA